MGILFFLSFIPIIFKPSVFLSDKFLVWGRDLSDRGRERVPLQRTDSDRDVLVLSTRPVFLPSRSDRVPPLHGRPGEVGEHWMSPVKILTTIGPEMGGFVLLDWSVLFLDSLLLYTSQEGVCHTGSVTCD